MIDWIREESHRFGLFSWDEARRFYCAMNDEELRDAWNAEFHWKCELDDVRHFRIANCHDTSTELEEERRVEEDLSSLSEETEEDRSRTSSSPSSSSAEELEEDRSRTSSSLSSAEELEEDETSTVETPPQPPSVGFLGSLSDYAMRAIRGLLKPLGLVLDSPSPHSLASDTCNVFGSGSSEQCLEMSSCEWVEDVFRCVPSSSSSSSSSVVSSPRVSPSPSPSLSSRESSVDLESIEDLESRESSVDSESIEDLEGLESVEESDVESTRTRISINSLFSCFNFVSTRIYLVSLTL